MGKMLSVISWLTSNGYIHTNLNLNSFVLADINSVKLGGLTHAMSFSDFLKFDPEYFDYCPPEFILGDTAHCEGYAVWNLACLFFEILTSRKAFGFGQMNPVQHINNIVAELHEPDPEFWKQLPFTSLIRPDPRNVFGDPLLELLPVW
jgi:serine/threonine protein kinase